MKVAPVSAEIADDRLAARDITGALPASITARMDTVTARR